MDQISPDTPLVPRHVSVVGDGRLGSAIAPALEAAGIRVSGPFGRGEAPVRADAVLLCVPDAEIPAAAELAAPTAPFVGHTSGATPVRPLGRMGFGLHPLQTFAGGDGPQRFHGAGCAVAGASPEALACADALARALGMRPFAIEDADRPAYHAAASIASNFLLTLQATAEEVAGLTGIEPAEARELLGPLVSSTVENWQRVGPGRALTGPVARGDEATVAVQRAAIEHGAPHLLSLFDQMVARTRALAGQAVPA